MPKKIVYRRILFIILIVSLLGIILFTYRNIDTQIPDEIKIIVGKEEKFDFDVPIKANLVTTDQDVFSVNNNQIESDLIHIDLNEPFTIKSSQTGEYSLNLSLFGILKWKQIQLDVIDTVELVPCGEPIGIYVKTDGVMVLGTSIITGIDGMNYEPALNKLKSGDYIVGINGTAVNTKQKLIHMIQESSGKSIALKVRREDEIVNVSIDPIETAIGEYKIGTWIRDDTQGIGTLTFVTSDGDFGALGHGITDIDTSLLMEVCTGDVYTAEIMSIVKGKNGSPGELIGLINQSENSRIGTIYSNTNQGIFGNLSNKYREMSMAEPLEIGLKQDVSLGDAVIRCNVDGEVKDYSIKIDKIDRSNNQLSKGLVIEITDERLLTLTGGIVQGMSGSPIIQDDKIIGAVTHVFIHDSTKGYGTFIENMVRNIE